MIIHLFDDEKFVDTTINKFEKLAAGKNRYLVFSNSQILKYPKRLDKIEILTDKWYKLDFNSIFKDCDLLVIHYLTPLKSYILKKTPKNVKVLWIAWGGDAYTNFKKFPAFEAETKKIVTESFKIKIRNTFLYDIYFMLKYGVKVLNKEKKALSKIDYVATVLPPEFELIKKEFSLNAEYVKFSYDSLNYILKSKLVFNLGENILIGNSATAYNNHLDIFKKIKSNNKLIVPLNYGDKAYRDIICNEGFKIYGSNFKPIFDFLEFNEYEALVRSCNSMVMYHIRQQGLGNILLGLFIGIRVYLNTKSVTYEYLTRIGFLIFNLDDHIEFLGIELKEPEKRINNQLVKEYWGEDKILEGTNNVIGLCGDFRKK